MNKYIWDIQTALVAEGFDPGPVDGLMGTKTYTAVIRCLAELRALRVSQSGSAEAVRIVAQQPVATRTINEIIIHCTATPEGRSVTVDEIRAWHRARNFRDIGYHYVVLLDGTIATGRPEAEIGAHCLWRNEGTLGVVYVGGVAADGTTPMDTRAPAQKASLEAIVRALCVKYPNITLVAGHNEYAAKACPSFSVRSDSLASVPAKI